MPSHASDFSTSYVYKSLRSRRHIRLLEFTSSGTANDINSEPTFSLVQVELSSDDAQLDFEALSYVWGHHDRVSSLHFQGQEGQIGLTANLTQALPHITRHSRTKRLWIDQLCINQADNSEKSIQVGLMSEIYKKAMRVIVWLGPADEHSRLCKQWVEGIEKLIPTMKSANKITIGSPEYDPNWRMLMLHDTFSSPGTSLVWAAAIGKFWGRMWFRRGWIVQEFLLAREVVCLTGDVHFSLQNLVDMFTVPSDDALSEATEGWLSYRILMQLITDPFADTPQPLKFLRVMAAVAQEFVTQELGDRLYGFIGMIEGLGFVPDYETSVKDNFTRFAATIARQYGSLDFLSLWSANLDQLMNDTPQELLGLPSWVPSFSATPLTAPWRLAVGAARSWATTVEWNAAAGRRHTHDAALDAAHTGRLKVHGHVIDHIDTMSSARIAQYWNVDEEYLTSIVTQIKSDLTGFEDWTQIELVDFLNIISHNGNTPPESGEQLLGLAPGAFGGESKHLSNHDASLGICLAMGRGRRFMRTKKGRAGLAPFIGSKGQEGDKRGSAIVVLHGCIVPIVLQQVGKNSDQEGGDWKVVGDCYVEGAMFGEAVNWDEGDARTFVLV